MKEKIFGLIALTTVVAQIKNPKNFLWDYVIGEEKAEKTARFEIQTKDEKRLRAPLVGKREAGVFVSKSAWKTNLYEPPRIHTYVLNEAEKMLEQQFGQTIYGDHAAAWRGQLADDLTFLKNIGFRTKNWMLAELLKTGICPTADGTEGVKFGDFKKTVLSGTSLFDNPDSDPIKWLQEQQLAIQKKTGIVVDTVITTPAVAAAINEHPKVAEYLKQTNANLYMINDKTPEKETGEKLEAIIPRLNIKIFSFVDWAQEIGDEKAEETEVLEEKHLILCKKGGFRCQYGAMALRPKQGTPAKLWIKKEVTRTFYPANSEDEVIEYFSAPLVSPKDASGWLYAQVIA